MTFQGAFDKQLVWFVYSFIISLSQRMYLVMELCDAGGIQKVLEEKTRFSEKVCTCGQLYSSSCVEYEKE